MIHDAICQVLKRWVVETGAAPGGSAFVAARHGGVWRSATGSCGAHSCDDPTPVTPETIYDLASVTKPVVACTLARRVGRAALTWDMPLGRILPEARGTPSEQTPLEHLLAHRAGLEAHIRLNAELPGAGLRRWLTRCASARRSDCGGELPAEGFPPLYSDLGYILVGAALEAHGSASLTELVATEVAEPLELDLAPAAAWARALAREWPRRVAPTEVVNERGGLLRGVVHDDNAWDIAGAGLAGHAGLFGTASSVGRFGTCVVDAVAGRSEWLAAAEAGVLVRPRSGGSLRAGFDGKAPSGSAAGSSFGSRTFGHLGFTGTSLWCDPDADIVVVLLTNRVNPTRDNILIRSVRPSVHDALFGLAADLRR